MPLFKSKKKTQTAEQEGRNEYNRYENGRSGGASGAGARTNPATSDPAGPPGGQIRTVNRHGTGGAAPRAAAQTSPQGHNDNASVNGAGEGVNGGRHHGGTRDRVEGRTEHAASELVGSQALRAKGAQREREAANIKAQSAELAEAERLEREAVLRRERAVAHGAHPANKHLGAGWADTARADKERY